MRGLAEIEAGFACYFHVAEAKDLALPGWRAIHCALTCENAIDAAKHREIARSAWTAIGRLDLVHDWADQEV